MLQCYDHWMMLPEKVREGRPWVRPVDRSPDLHEKRVDESGNLHKEAADARERGQMELFA